MLLFPNKNAGYNFIHNDCNWFSLNKKKKKQKYTFKGEKSRELWKKRRKYCVNTAIH